MTQNQPAVQAWYLIFVPCMHRKSLKQHMLAKEMMVNDLHNIHHANADVNTYARRVALYTTLVT